MYVHIHIVADAVQSHSIQSLDNNKSACILKAEWGEQFFSIIQTCTKSRHTLDTVWDRRKRPAYDPFVLFDTWVHYICEPANSICYFRVFWSIYSSPRERTLSCTYTSINREVVVCLTTYTSIVVDMWAFDSSRALPSRRSLVGQLLTRLPSRSWCVQFPGLGRACSDTCQMLDLFLSDLIKPCVGAVWITI